MKRNLRYFFFLLLLFIQSFHLIAQKPRLIFHQLNLNHGLSENTVRCILEDQKGFMWFGTQHGLNKYDGYKFKTYLHNPSDTFSISNNSNKFLFKDSKGNLWCITRDGLNLYDPIADRFYNYRSPLHKGLHPIRGDIEAMAEDANGTLWIAGGSEGLFKLQSLTEISEKYHFNSNDLSAIFISIKPDKNGLLYVGTRDGLLLFNPKQATFTDLRPFYGKGYQVRNIHIDKKGRVWLATTEGMKMIDRPNGIFKEFFNNPLDEFSLNNNNTFDIVPDQSGNLFIAIDGGGIDYYDINTDKFYHYTSTNGSQLSSNNITSILLDSKENLWAGTFLNGINFSNTTTNLFAVVKNTPYNTKTIQQGIVTNFLMDSKGTFWVATDGGGLYRKPKGKTDFVNYRVETDKEKLSSNAVIRLLEDSEGKIWISTYGGGLICYDYSTDSFITYKHDPSDPQSVMNNKLYAIIEYEGKIWVSTYGTGISIFDKKTGKFKHHLHKQDDKESIPSDWTHCFYKDKNGTLWIGTFNGLSKYLPEKGTFKNYSFNETTSLSDKNFLHDIVGGDQEDLWLASSGGGLIQFNTKTEKYKIYTEQNGLSNNTIRSLIQDNEGYLWLGTINGVTRFNTKTKTGRPYTIKDGAPATSFYSSSKYKDENGLLYFGTQDGYLVIDPSQAVINKYVPPIVITGLKLFNKTISNHSENSPLKSEINEAKEIVLSHEQNAITLEFSALNFNNSKNNHFLYKLEGLENEWNQASSNNFAVYTNLPPGKYNFRVIGSNNDGIWNKEGASLKIIITPPFWKTHWFILLVTLLLILILFVLHRWRLERIKRKNKVLERIIEERTKELKVSNEQLEAFVYKASHDIKGPLKSIIGLTALGKKEVDDPVAIEYFNHILKSTKKLDKLLMELLQLARVKRAVVKKEKVKFENLIQDAISHFKHFPDFDKIKIEVEVFQPKDFYSDRNLIYSIIQNLIENPIKYQDKRKEERFLKISVAVSEKAAYLIFEDNGMGIPEQYHEKVFDMFFKVNEGSNGTGLGLYLVRTTVEKLKGHISLISEEGQGTSFYVELIGL